MVGLWVMEVLVIPMLGSDLYHEGLVSYGFATHVWETGGRDLVRIKMVSRRGGRGRFECGGQCRRWGEDVLCDMHCGEVV